MLLNMTMKFTVFYVEKYFHVVKLRIGFANKKTPHLRKSSSIPKKCVVINMFVCFSEI